MSIVEQIEVKTKRNNRSEHDDREIDLIDVIHHLYAHKRTILLTVLLLFSAALTYVFLATPIYRADTLLQVEERNTTIPGLDEISGMFGDQPKGSAEIVVIKSRRILGAAVDNLQLNYQVEPDYFPVFGKGVARRYSGEALAEPFLGLDSYAWGGEDIKLQRFEIEGKLRNSSTNWRILAGEEGSFELLDADGNSVLLGKVGEFTQAKYRKSTIRLFVSLITARTGTAFIIEYSSRISTLDRLKESLYVTEAGKDSGMITLTLQGEDREKIIEILDEITNKYVRANVEQHSQEAEKILQFIDSQLPALKKRLDIAELALQDYQQTTGTVDLEFETQTTVTKLIELENKISELKLEETELSQRFTELHPSLRVIKKQIAQFEVEKRKIEQQLNTLPETEWEFIQKTRDVKVATELYVTLLNKGQELKVAKAGTVGNVRILDIAEAHDEPVKPKKAFILLLSILIGLLLGIGFVLMRRVFHRGVQDPDEIERETGLSVYATIPHSDIEEQINSDTNRNTGDKRQELNLLAIRKNDELAIEAIRSFRTSMRFLLNTKEHKIVIIAGPSPGIGKSFVSANYAAVSASEGQRVLLIDADMRKGHLYNSLGTRKVPGLSEWITGEASTEEVIREVHSDLFFIPCGKRPPNPAELLATDRFKMLLKGAREKFDLVIIDTPPILAVTDASIIAQYGGQLFVVLRSGQHRMNEVKAAVSRFEKDGVSVAGILINDSPLMDGNSTNKYGYTYHYDYN